MEWLTLKPSPDFSNWWILSIMICIFHKVSSKTPHILSLVSEKEGQSTERFQNNAECVCPNIPRLACPQGFAYCVAGESLPQNITLKYSVQLPCAPGVQSTAALFLKAHLALLSKERLLLDMILRICCLSSGLGCCYPGGSSSVCINRPGNVWYLNNTLSILFSHFELSHPHFFFWIMVIKNLPLSLLWEWNASKWLCFPREVLLGLHSFIHCIHPGSGLPTPCCQSTCWGLVILVFLLVCRYQ